MRGIGWQCWLLTVAWSIDDDDNENECSWLASSVASLLIQVKKARFLPATAPCHHHKVVGGADCRGRHEE